jgi:hypothetical protein
MVVIGEIRVRSCLEMRECAIDTHVWSFYLLYSPFLFPCKVGIFIKV